MHIPYLPKHAAFNYKRLLCFEREKEELDGEYLNPLLHRDGQILAMVLVIALIRQAYSSTQEKLRSPIFHFST